MKKLLINSIFLLISAVTFSQSKFAPVSVTQGTFVRETPALGSFPNKVIPENWRDNIRVVPNNLRNAAKVNEDALPQGKDPLAELNEASRQSRGLLLDFDGITLSEGGAVPPDPTGAVGPNHYVHAVNNAIKIFDKTGDLLSGPIELGVFFENGENYGDPIVLYDQLADRWFLSQFISAGDVGLLIAISTSPDPLGTYNIYEYTLDSFPDYPHYTVWPDGYYLTANKFVGNTTYVIDRAAMLDGAESPAIIGFNLPGVVRNPNTVFSPQPANLLGTDFPADTPGYIVYLQDDAWGGVSFDHLKVWEIDIDFETPNNSTISAPQEIATTPFDTTFFPFGTGDVPQPGTDVRLDNIGGVISYMANYRSFPTHNSFLINFNVDVDGFNNSGIRWIELRNSGTDDFEIYQEGTWSIEDSNSRFMGSMGMDAQGNIALAYNVGGFNTPIALRFTGRMANDPLGQMSFQETSIVEGVDVQDFTNRFGDYAQMTMDPDGETFWYTAEYFSGYNFWTSKIAAFNLENLTLGIAETSTLNNALVIYPDGATNYILEIEGTMELSDPSFVVYDIQGKEVKNGGFKNNSSKYQASFNASNLSSGVYVVKVSETAANGFSVTKKLIIN